MWKKKSRRRKFIRRKINFDFHASKFSPSLFATMIFITFLYQYSVLDSLHLITHRKDGWEKDCGLKGMPLISHFLQSRLLQISSSFHSNSTSGGPTNYSHELPHGISYSNKTNAIEIENSITLTRNKKTKQIINTFQEKKIWCSFGSCDLYSISQPDEQYDDRNVWKSKWMQYCLSYMCIKSDPKMANTKNFPHLRHFPMLYFVWPFERKHNFLLPLKYLWTVQTISIMKKESVPRLIEIIAKPPCLYKLTMPHQDRNWNILAH